VSRPLIIEHNHQPIYRVVRRGAGPLETAGRRQRVLDHPFSHPEDPTLYCCCSEWVARAVTLERFRVAGLDVSDLQPGARPQLVELSWSGQVVDLASEDGVAAAGFPPDFPEGVRPEQTRRAAGEWRSAGAAGVVYRSGALRKRGFKSWEGSHKRWSELAVFLDRCGEPPKLLRLREDQDWL